MQETKFIFWDGSKMVHKRAIEAVDRMLRDVRTMPNSVMGGVVLLLTGDTRPPLWPHVQIVSTYKNVK